MRIKLYVIAISFLALFCGHWDVSHDFFISTQLKNSTFESSSKTLKTQSEFYKIIATRNPAQGDLGIKRLSANKILRSLMDSVAWRWFFSLDQLSKSTFPFIQNGVHPPHLLLPYQLYEILLI